MTLEDLWGHTVFYEVYRNRFINECARKKKTKFHSLRVVLWDIEELTYLIIINLNSKFQLGINHLLHYKNWICEVCDHDYRADCNKSNKFFKINKRIGLNVPLHGLLFFTF